MPKGETDGKTTTYQNGFSLHTSPSGIDKNFSDENEQQAYVRNKNHENLIGITALFPKK